MNFSTDVVYPVARFAGEEEEGPEGEAQLPLVTQPRESVSNPKTFLIIVKSFVASGVLFLPNAFRLGGILFSSFSLAAVALISTIAMIFLVQCKQAVGGTFGEIAEKAYGRIARIFVEISLVISQLGFCAAYLVFVAELFQQIGAFLFQCSETFTNLPFSVFIAIQFAIYVPLVWVRNMHAFAIPSLFADSFIAFGLVIVSYFAAQSIAQNGIQVPSLIAPTFPMFIGTAVYTFEGIGLILPIEESMTHKESFPKLLSWTMVLLLTIFLSFSALCFLAYGDDIRTIVLLNMPQDSRLSQAALFLYSFAMIATFPLQFFPAIKILESKLFPRHEMVSRHLQNVEKVNLVFTEDTLPEEHKYGRISWALTWKKNLFRTFLVTVLVGIAIVGSSQLDSFVSLIGAVCCIPLAFIYPTLFHYKLVAKKCSVRFKSVPSQQRR